MIADGWRRDIHSYIAGTLRGMNATPLAIGGVEDHVHFLAGLRATHCVADVVREVKKASSVWAKEHGHELSWQTGYGAFSVSQSAVPTTVAYIVRQEEHHQIVSSAEEMRALLAEFEVAYDEKYFE